MGNDLTKGGGEDDAGAPGPRSDGRKKTSTAVTPGMFIQQQSGVFEERYQGMKVLGKGSFGEVILCKDKTTGLECAVKVISKKTMKKGASASTLLREVQLLKELDHPNIMKLYEFFEDSGYFYLVSELYTGGELFDEIINRKRFSEADAAKYIRQILSGIAYMHVNAIVHRDLKPENLLLENKTQGSPIKIIDFGLSTHFEPEDGEEGETKKQAKMRDKIGTAYYIAPEVLKGPYDEKCDVWSAGVILYILLSGSPPFYGNTEHEILKRVEAGSYTFSQAPWRKISSEARDLIRRMLRYQPKERISALDALQHPWLTQFEEGAAVDLPLLENTMSNMRRWQGQQRISQAAMLYMGSKLTTPEETQKLTEMFQTLDKNGDGRLDRDELKDGYVKLMKLKGEDLNTLDEQAITAELETVFSSVDFDNNGFLEYSEFVTVAMNKQTLLSEERLKRAFSMFDRDGSGKVSAVELMELFGSADKAKIEALVKEVDINNDGEVDFEEFAAMVRKYAGA